MTQELREEFDQYLESISSGPDAFRLPDYLSDHKILACLQDNAQKKTFLLENRNGRKMLCKYACGEFQAMLQMENDFSQSESFSFLPYVIDYRETENGAFLLREYIEGQTLREMVDENGPLSVAKALPIIKDICRCLKRLHNMTPPTIHRDVKPSNIVLTKSGDCYFVDMGTLRRYQEDSSTDTICMGTVDFAAPEQFGARQTDARTDIYGLGVLFAYLLTGESKIQSDVLARIPRKIAVIIKKCTSFNPDERYDNIDQVEKVLENIELHQKLLPSRILAAITSVFALALLISILDFPSKEVKFSSPLLEQAVREELKKAPEEPIYEEDLEQIVRLSICGSVVFHDAISHDRAYYPHLVNGQETGTGDISDISILSHMPNLQYLRLDYQHIHDIRPLKNLPLITLSLSGNPVSDISVLSQCTTLETLEIADTYVSDLTPLKNCQYLDTLDCCRSQVRHFAALSELNLRELDMQAVPADDFTDLENLSVTILKCQNLPDGSLSHIVKMPNLRTLFVYSSNITSLKQFSEFTELTYLDVYSNFLQNLEGAEALQNLEFLGIGANPLTDMSAISSLKKLHYLHMWNTGLTDFSFLNDIPWLEMLDVSPETKPYVLEAVPNPWFKFL